MCVCVWGEGGALLWVTPFRPNAPALPWGRKRARVARADAGGRRTQDVRFFFFFLISHGEEGAGGSLRVRCFFFFLAFQRNVIVVFFLFLLKKVRREF